MRVRREEGVLIRVLGVIVRRGFEPMRVRAKVSANGRTIGMLVTVEGERDVDVLARQLARLDEMEHVEVMSAAADTVRSPDVRADL